jgi:hypothetical protein
LPPIGSITVTSFSVAVVVLRRRSSTAGGVRAWAERKCPVPEENFGRPPSAMLGMSVAPGGLHVLTAVTSRSRSY